MDEQVSHLFYSSSNHNQASYFALQPLRAGYLKPADLDYRRRVELREAILTEIGKERIRQEIIMEDIKRKRAVFNELRNSLSSQTAAMMQQPRLHPSAEPMFETTPLKVAIGRLGAARLGSMDSWPPVQFRY